MNLNPFSYKRAICVETSTGVSMPIGYITKCGLPVFYGVMWRLVHLDFSLTPPVKTTHKIV